MSSYRVSPGKMLAAALAFLVADVGLTRLVVGTGMAPEVAPGSAGLLELGGWPLWIAVYLGVVRGSFFAADYLEAGELPRLAQLLRAVTVTTIGAAVVTNVAGLATIGGLPDSAPLLEIGALVATTAGLSLVVRTPTRSLDVARRARGLAPSRLTVGITVTVFLVAMSPILPFLGLAGPLASPVQTASAEAPLLTQSPYDDDPEFIYSSTNTSAPLQYQDSDGTKGDYDLSLTDTYAAFQFDGSGAVEVFSANTSGVYYETLGDTSAATQVSTKDAAVTSRISHGDIDNDGDVEAIYETGGSTIYHVDAKGESGSISVSSLHETGGVGDFDGDGSNELLFVTGETTKSLDTVEADGTTNADIVTGVKDPGQFADYDGDGNLEATYRDSNDNIDYVTSSGTETDTGADSFGGLLETGDWDEDGTPDIFVENGNGFQAIEPSGSAITLSLDAPDSVLGVANAQVLESVTVSGTITDGSGNPLPNATVAIGAGSTTYTTTNSKGEYSLTSSDTLQSVSVEAAKSGYFRNSSTLTLDGDKTVNLSLTAQSDPSTGSVKTGFDNPAVGAKIEAIDPISGQVLETTIADANGEYSLSQTGDVLVRASRVDTESASIETEIEAGGFIETLYLGLESSTKKLTLSSELDPLTGNTLANLDLTEVAECDTLIESRIGEAATYIAFGGVPAAADALGIYEFGPSACEPDTAKQERLALLAGSTSLNQSEQNTRVVTNNYLTDARQIAYADGKIAAINALKNDAVPEQAKFEANQSVDRYYNSVYVNTASGYSTAVLQGKYIYEREYSATDSTGEWVYPVDANGNRLNFSANPWEEVTVELPEGDETMWAYRLESGELVTPFPDKTTAPGGGPYISGPSLRVEGPDDTSDTLSGGAYTTIAKSGLFGDIVTEVDGQRTQVKDNLALTIDGTLAEIDPANISSTDFLSPSEIAGRASTDYESTGYYGFAAAQLAATGYAGDINASQTIQLADGSTRSGTLFYTGDDLTSIDVNETYDPTAYNGSFLFATNEEIVELRNQFKVTEQTDVTDGTAKNSTTVETYVYNTTNTSSLESDLEKLSILADRYQRAQSASGFGFDLGGSNQQAVIALLAVVGALLLLRD